MFIAENQKIFDEWYSIFENIIIGPNNNHTATQNSINKTANDQLSSPVSFSESICSLKSNEIVDIFNGAVINLNEKFKSSPLCMNDLQSVTNDINNSTHVSSLDDTTKSKKSTNLKIKNLDLNKVIYAFNYTLNI